MSEPSPLVIDLRVRLLTSFDFLHFGSSCLYAVKKSKRPVVGVMDEKNALKEVYAHAMLSSLGAHQNILRYFSVWKEDNHLFIQNELCDLGTLDSFKTFDEKLLLDVLKQVLEGLRFIHEGGFVHLDIKPDNIFVSSALQPASRRTRAGDDEGFGGEESSSASEKEAPPSKYVFKIGDFGLMTKTDDPKVEEGDSRYLPKEILEEDYSHLPKGDIFALGLSIYELASGAPLPKNGELWQQLRTGHVPLLEGYSKEFNAIIRRTTHQEAAQRPTATELLLHPLIHQNKDKENISKLKQELVKERMKNESLQRELKRKAEETHPRAPPGKLQRANTIF